MNTPRETMDKVIPKKKGFRRNTLDMPALA
jgi:hypothetical protein